MADKTSSLCGVANPGGVPCTKEKGHSAKGIDAQHDFASYGPPSSPELVPERIWIDEPMLKTARARKAGTYYFDAGIESDRAIEFTRTGSTSSPEFVRGYEQAREGVCWHCGVVLAYVPKLRCEDCPDECDTEGCDEMGCTLTPAPSSPAGWIYEDQLPATISKPDYNAWFDRSRVIDGVRMGPPFESVAAPVDAVESSLQHETESCPDCEAQEKVAWAACNESTRAGSAYLKCEKHRSPESISTGTDEVEAIRALPEEEGEQDSR